MCYLCIHTHTIDNAQWSDKRVDVQDGASSVSVAQRFAPPAAEGDAQGLSTRLGVVEVLSWGGRGRTQTIAHAQWGVRSGDLGILYRYSLLQRGF